MEVIYNNKLIKNNQYVKVVETQIKPQIVFDENKNNIYTLIMYDPDAINGTHIHWIVSDIKDNNIENGKVLIPYKGPAPPPKTGKHRYIFELYLQGNNLNINERSISIISVRNKMSLNEPIYKIQFISQNESGGKKRKTKRKLRRRRTRRNY
jgi:phosphatidylethanolamine-binding protein (PEBP) family uncharacterized protein